ncbi:hypothetical protein KEM52_003174 [Ascosphaera acerosa]|nr:hypothetical protein KEM52_003174 [Ascosphaera acerosa]
MSEPALGPLPVADHARGEDARGEDREESTQQQQQQQQQATQAVDTQPPTAETGIATNGDGDGDGDGNGNGAVSASAGNATEPPAQPQLGPRAARLGQVYAKALHSTLRANSYANFAACFPTPAARAARTLESVWRQLNSKLELSAQAEFQDILQERNAIGGLNELDRMIAEARERQRSGQEPDATPPHTLPPDELYRAHLAPYLEQAKQSLGEQITSTEDENTALAETIQRQRRQIQALLARLDSVAADIEEAAAVAVEASTRDVPLRTEAGEVYDEVVAMAET